MVSEDPCPEPSPPARAESTRSGTEGAPIRLPTRRRAAAGLLQSPAGSPDIRDVNGSRLKRWLRGIASQQAGFSLMELLVAQGLFLLVIGGALSMLDTQSKLAPRDQERAFAMREAQVGMAGLVRELRQTKTVVFASASRFEVELIRNGALRRVGYKCDEAPAVDDPGNPYDQTYVRCMRVEGPAGAALPSYGTGRPVIDRLLTGTVFSYSPNSSSPTYVTTTVRVPSRGERKEANSNDIVLDTGFFMPNRSTLG